MISAPLPDDETERLRALARYAVLDTPAEQTFDELTELAAELCGTPIALVSLVDAHRQWFKSRVGLDASETPRELAFCAHAILDDAVMVVPDAFEDPRFADNPLVTGAPDVRFYAGAPLITHDGHRLGTLCVIDRTPRQLTPTQLRALHTLGRQVISQLELRRSAALLARRLMTVEAAQRNAPTDDASISSERSPSQRPPFLAHITHDLRTPLNAILGFAEHLGEEEPVAEEERREIAARIEDAGRYMLRLVNDILDVAHLDSGQVRFEIEATDVGELARATLEAVRPLALAGGNQTSFVGAAAGPTIQGDPLRIRQVLSNLLSNACKYTKDGEIRVCVAAEGEEWVRVDVVDTGIGMTEAQRRQLFRPFAQVQERAQQSREGTGLGLHITRALCERMGGALSAESAAGVGSTFTAWLPTTPRTPRAGTPIAVAEGDPRVRAAIQRALGGVAPLVYIDGVAEVLWTTVERRWRAVLVDTDAGDADEPELLRALARMCDETAARLLLIDGDPAGSGGAGRDPADARWSIGDDPELLRQAVLAAPTITVARREPETSR